MLTEILDGKAIKPVERKFLLSWQASRESRKRQQSFVGRPLNDLENITGLWFTPTSWSLFQCRQQFLTLIYDSPLKICLLSNNQFTALPLLLTTQWEDFLEGGRGLRPFWLNPAAFLHLQRNLREEDSSSILHLSYGSFQKEVWKILLYSPRGNYLVLISASARLKPSSCQWFSLSKPTIFSD